MTTHYTPARIEESGRVLARVSDGMLRVPNDDHLKRYTAYCDSPDDPGEYEEIDLDAINARYARQCAEMELARGYEPGMRVAEVEERFGLYM